VCAVCLAVTLGAAIGTILRRPFLFVLAGTNPDAPGWTKLIRDANKALKKQGPVARQKPITGRMPPTSKSPTRVGTNTKSAASMARDIGSIASQTLVWM
jgi:hypothetical protein